MVSEKLVNFFVFKVVLVVMDDGIDVVIVFAAVVVVVVGYFLTSKYLSYSCHVGGSISAAGGRLICIG